MEKYKTSREARTFEDVIEFVKERDMPGFKRGVRYGTPYGFSEVI